MSVVKGRMTADFSGLLVVFVIVMRINRFHRIAAWWPG